MMGVDVLEFIRLLDCSPDDEVVLLVQIILFIRLLSICYAVCSKSQEYSNLRRNNNGNYLTSIALEGRPVCSKCTPTRIIVAPAVRPVYCASMKQTGRTYGANGKRWAFVATNRSLLWS